MIYLAIYHKIVKKLMIDISLEFVFNILIIEIKCYNYMKMIICYHDLTILATDHGVIMSFHSVIF